LTVLLLAGATVGSLVCGWACPFGFVQDLIGKVAPYQLPIPRWLGSARYVVLVGLVLILPLFLGYHGIPFEEQGVSICRLCPAGALEAGLPYSIQSLLSGQGWLMSGLKSGILMGFVVACLVVHRPWCRIFCPLGGLLALFNRWSLFHLHYQAKACVECNLCRSRCAMDVHVDERVNVAGCIRCLECTTCGAIESKFSRPDFRLLQTSEPPRK
jgi:polyferredoxin